MTIGILSDTSLPLPLLLDAINHAEVGHLPRNQQLTVISDDGAEGPYQFLPKNLHDMGYGMPRNIPVADIRDYKKARGLAGKYVTGFSEELGFKTPLEQLVAYTAGPTFASDWVARGANIEELGPRTQRYIKRAAAYLNDNYTQQQEPQMADITFDISPIPQVKLPMPFDEAGIEVLKQMARDGNPVAQSFLERINRAGLSEEDIERTGVDRYRPGTVSAGKGSVAAGGTLARDSIMDDLLRQSKDLRRQVDAQLYRPGAVPSGQGSVAAGGAPTYGALYRPGTVPSGMGRLAAGGAERQEALERELRRQVGASLYRPGTVPAGEGSVAAGGTAPVLAEPPGGVQYDVGGDTSSQTSGALYRPGTVPAGMGSIAAGGVLQNEPIEVAITEANGFTRNPPPNVSNRRDQSAMSLQPPPRGNINDLLIRMGSAGLRGAQQGGLESMAAMGDAYTAYKAAERDSIVKYNQSLAKMAGKKQRPGGNPVSPYNAVVLDTLNDIIPALDGDTSWWSKEAGLPGAIFRMIPGSRAKDFEAKLDTLKANIGFDRLQKMRDESPTGGALGQVSEMELRQLNAALGSLDQKQSPQQLQENLKRIRDHYIRAVSALEAEYAAAGIDISSKIQPMGSAGGQAANNNLSAADAIVGIN